MSLNTVLDQYFGGSVRTEELGTSSFSTAGYRGVFFIVWFQCLAFFHFQRQFMQRGLDSQTKKQLEEEEKKIISEEHWYLDVPDLKEKESCIIEERSFLRCEDLVYGRMSFKGFNPEIEKLMIQMNSKCKEEKIEEDDKMEADVSDEEMARRYETLVGTIGKKFLRKRDQRVLKDDDEDDEVEEGNSNTRPSKRAKKMFLKPQD
uniref:M-phase phosphoprotein 6 n=1 Tax=Serinus canaria TaxID=9135 RepID=A0A8C9MVJ3_SERCA